LGGHANQWRKQLPTAYPYESLMPPVIEKKIQEVSDHPLITVRTETVVARIAGEPGNFTVTVAKKARGIHMDRCTGCRSCVDNCPVQYQAAEN